MINKTPQFLVPFSLGIAGLIAIVTSTIIDIDNSKIVEITWTASVFIVLSVLTMRFYSLDIEGFVTTINETNPGPDLNARKYVDWMTISMLVGLAATVIIHYDFIFGVLTYLLMQISLIIAFSGISTIRRKSIMDSGFVKLKQISLRSMIFWILMTLLVYFIFVFDGSSASFIILPYVAAIAIMAHYSWYGLAYVDRKAAFRMFPVLASGLFFFSDAIIGAGLFGPYDVPRYLNLIIDLTYVFNIFFMSQAMLFLGPLKR